MSETLEERTSTVSSTWESGLGGSEVLSIKSSSSSSSHNSEPSVSYSSLHWKKTELKYGILYKHKN